MPRAWEKLPRLTAREHCGLDASALNFGRYDAAKERDPAARATPPEWHESSMTTVLSALALKGLIMLVNSALDTTRMSCITRLSVHWPVALLRYRAPCPEKYT